MSYESAIWAIPADDRDIWIKVGMALKVEAGEDGWQLFDEWSQSGAGYKASDAKAAWKSFPSHGRISIGTLYWLAREHGWDGKIVLSGPDPAARRRREQEINRQAIQAEWEALAVAEAAEGMLRSCHRGWHPYLVGKGFPSATGFLFTGSIRFPNAGMREFKGALFLPIRRIDNGKLMSAELITDDGKKLFLPGGRRTGTGVRLCSGPRLVLCEGYATGLSLQLALQRMSITAEVVCVLSASSYASAAAIKAPWLVVADNDANGVGERSARAVCARVAVPPEGDANDYHQAKGLPALCDLIRSAISQPAPVPEPLATP